MEMLSRLANRRETTVETALRPIDRPIDLAAKSPLMLSVHISRDLTLPLSLFLFYCRVEGCVGCDYRAATYFRMKSVFSDRS